jgi:hypothetical protein
MFELVFIELTNVFCNEVYYVHENLLVKFNKVQINYKLERLKYNILSAKQFFLSCYM